MAISRNKADSAYGFSQPFVNVVQSITSVRNPTVNDVAVVGTQWINRVGNSAFTLTSVVNSQATWTSGVNAAAAFAVGTALTVGTTAVIGTTATIGTGLTVSAGGATITGNSAVTGSFTASTSITATAGDIIATAGDIEATAGDIVATAGDISLEGAAASYYLPDGMRITSGAGVPANGLALVIGDIYIRTNPAGAASRIYIATAVGTWTNVTCAA